jgi:hypothetical protein
MASDGAVFDTLTVNGTYIVTITATDKNGCTGMRIDTMVVNCQTMNITTLIIPDGMINVPFSSMLHESGGMSPKTWTISSGMPPMGLSLTDSTLSGTPIILTGPFTFTVTVTDAAGCTASQTYTMTISNPKPVIVSLSPNSAAAGSGGFTLTVYGNKFVPNSVVCWNNQSRPTIYIDSATVTASISAADIASAGTVIVKVFNPTPGGGDSYYMPFIVYPVTQIVTTITFPAASCYAEFQNSDSARVNFLINSNDSVVFQIKYDQGANIGAAAKLFGPEVIPPTYAAKWMARTLHGLALDTSYAFQIFYKNSVSAMQSTAVFTCATVTTVEEVNNETSFKIFPNPTSRSSQIIAPNNVDGFCKLYDIQGRMVKRFGITAGKGEILRDELHMGIYLYEVSAKDGTVLKRGKLSIVD